MTDQSLDFCRREQAGDTARQLPDDARLSFLHLCDIDAEVAGGDAVARELVIRPVIKLRGLEQGLGRYAACVEAGAAERVLAVAIGPFVDAGDTHAVLRGPDGRNVAGRTGADDDDVK